MSKQESHLKCLLSPARSGTFFATFRSRSANPDGFDSKMRMWINSVEEWTVSNNRLVFCLKDIHQTFVSDTGVRPDKECIRLVMSEMKRRLRIAPLDGLKTSNFWSTSKSKPIFDNYIDPRGWLGWGVKTLVYNPASWAISAINSNHDQAFSDLTDMSITDTKRFVCQASLSEMSQNLLTELVRICRAEKQFCFEWQHLLELVTPIINTIIDATDGKELLLILDILIDHLALNKQVATLIDNDCKLVKIANPENSNEIDVMITKKNVAMARLLRAKEKLAADSDKYHNQASQAKQEALECYNKKEIVKAKSLLRSHKRYTACADQKEAQLSNVEVVLDQLENTDSNMMILQAYKDGADALRTANTNLENNTSILDDMLDVTAEARYLNDEMNQMLNNISYASLAVNNTSTHDLENELNNYLAPTEEKSSIPLSRNADPNNSNLQEGAAVDTNFIDELEEKLNKLVVCNDDPFGKTEKEEEISLKKNLIPSTAT